MIDAWLMPFSPCQTVFSSFKNTVRDGDFSGLEAYLTVVT